MAIAAIVNAAWDLWAKSVGKPVWKLLADMSPEELIGCVPFRYITDALTPDEALEIVHRNEPSKAAREAILREQGYPAYTTSAGWLGYSDAQLRALCRAGLDGGWAHFKVKVGRDLQDDVRRVSIIRQEIGLIHHIGIVDGYFPCRMDDAHQESSAHFICEKCGCVTEVSVPQETVDATHRQAQEHEFLPTGIKLEVLGLCAHCQE